MKKAVIFDMDGLMIDSGKVTYSIMILMKIFIFDALGKINKQCASYL